jgi:putative aldouronate transport system substrate-binding protein
MPTPAGLSYSEFRYQYAPIFTPLIITGDCWGSTITIMEEDYSRLEWFRTTLRPFITQRFIFSYPTAEESRWLLAQGRDIGEYFAPIQARWMIQGGIQQEWDAVQARLRAMGSEQYTRIMQDQIDRFNRNMR